MSQDNGKDHVQRPQYTELSCYPKFEGLGPATGPVPSVGAPIVNNTAVPSDNNNQIRHNQLDSSDLRLPSLRQIEPAKPVIPSIKRTRGGTYYTYKNPQYQHSKSNQPSSHSFQIQKPRAPIRSRDHGVDSGAESPPVLSNSASEPDETPKSHACEFEGCTWSFSRPSDLRRHFKSHQKPMFHCPYWKNDPSCHRNGGSFNRLDVLKRHLKLVHYVRDKHDAFNGEGDSGWCRTCQRMFQSSKVFVEHCAQCANSPTVASNVAPSV